MVSSRSLRNISDKLKFESSEDDILKDFYIPMLQNAVRYDRIAGFFSSSSLALAVDGFSEFFINSGKMRIICCARMSEEDVKSFSMEKFDLAEAVKKLSLVEIRDHIIFNRMKILSWLVSTGRLEIRIAFFKNSREQIVPTDALHHSKVGVVEGDEGNKISFSGSVNESALGWGLHIEEFKVFRNWIPAQKDYFILDAKKFENYWEGKNKKVILIEIPEAIKNELIEFAPKGNFELNEAVVKFKKEVDEKVRKRKNDMIPEIPARLIWRKHQKIAIEEWIKNNGRGVFKMATGAGKTKSALGALTKLGNILKNSGELPLVVVMVCPYQHLVRQWERDCHDFNMRPVSCFRSRQLWENKLAREINLVNSEQQQFLSIIVTNATFVSDVFQTIILRVRRKLLLICDEAHNLGSAKARNKLLENANFRLALSATFERHNDEEGTYSLQEYFGDVCIDFGLKEAIESECLCQYDYFPIVVHLTEEENDHYEALTRSIYQRMGNIQEPNINDERVKMLLLKRARIVAGAKNKYVELKKIFSEMENSKKVKNTLIFCGDGQTECEIDGIIKKQVLQVTQLLGNEFGLSISSYTAETSLESRDNIVNLFEKGDTQAVVAIRCLDEGVDIPVAECAYFLASTTNPRQFIQRRGRILRKNPKNPDKIAVIHDFLVMPRCAGQGFREEGYAMERGLVKRELARAIDFAKYARNKYASMDKFLVIQREYGLLDL